MKQVFIFTALFSFSANSALPEWFVNSDNSQYSLTGSHCVLLEQGKEKTSYLISKSIAQANLIEKNGVTVSSFNHLEVNQDTERFNQTITTESNGFIANVEIIEQGIYQNEAGQSYACSWVGTK
jgi:hypothetical protein